MPTGELVGADHVVDAVNQAKISASVAKNGVQEAIKYVTINGTKYVVDGNHRLRAAIAAGLKDVPAEEVTLPYKGFRNEMDVIWSSLEHALEQ